MLKVLENIVGYIIMSLLFGGLWEFISFFVIYFLCKIRDKEVPEDFGNNFGLYWLTNSILLLGSWIFILKK